MKWKAAYAEVQGDQAPGQGETLSEEEQERRDGADKDFKSLLEVKPELALSAGLGAGFEFKIGLSPQDKIYMTLKGHLVLGPGGGGGVAAELSVLQVVELVQFIRWSLEQSDFRFLEWVESEAFSLISLMLRVQAISGEDLVDIVAKPILDLRKYWDEARKVTKRPLMQRVNWRQMVRLPLTHLKPRRNCFTCFQRMCLGSLARMGMTTGNWHPPLSLL